jgi:hypothetical protein
VSGVSRFVKRGAKTSDTLDAIIGRDISQDYVTVVCAGSNDISKNNAKEGLRNIINFARRTSHTNIMVMEVLHRRVLRHPAAHITYTLSRKTEIATPAVSFPAAMTTWAAGNGRTVSTFLARTSRNISTIGTFQKRLAEVATVYKEMKRPQQLVVDMMEDTVRSVQCIQYNTM